MPPPRYRQLAFRRAAGSGPTLNVIFRFLEPGLRAFVHV